MRMMKKILSYMNDLDSPINLRSNMLLSVPFVCRKNGTLKYCVFSYSVKRDEGGKTAYIFSELFYFDRNDFTKYEIEEIDLEKIKLDRQFALRIKEFGKIEYPKEEIYARLVLLTDDILDHSSERREKAKLYISLFNQKYNENIQKVYMNYGNEYFHWIYDLACEKGDTY